MLLCREAAEPKARYPIISYITYVPHLDSPVDLLTMITSISPRYNSTHSCLPHTSRPDLNLLTVSATCRAFVFGCSTAAVVVPFKFARSLVGVVTIGTYLFEVCSNGHLMAVCTDGEAKAWREKSTRWCTLHFLPCTRWCLLPAVLVTFVQHLVPA